MAHVCVWQTQEFAHHQTTTRSKQNPLPSACYLNSRALLGAIAALSYEGGSNIIDLGKSQAEEESEAQLVSRIAIKL